jgi:hypothetical protein
VTLFGGTLTDQLAQIDRGDVMTNFTTPRYSGHVANEFNLFVEESNSTQP